MLHHGPFTAREITARRICVNGREWDLTSRPQLEQLAHSLGVTWHETNLLTAAQLRELVWQLILPRGVR